MLAEKIHREYNARVQQLIKEGKEPVEAQKIAEEERNNPVDLTTFNNEQFKEYCAQFSPEKQKRLAEQRAEQINAKSKSEAETAETAEVGEDPEPEKSKGRGRR